MAISPPVRQPGGSTKPGGGAPKEVHGSWPEIKLSEANVSGKGQAAAAEPGKDLQPELLKAAARREGAAAQRSELELEPLKLVVQLMRTQSVLLDSISEHHKLGNGLKADVQSFLQHKTEQADVQALTGKMEELQRMVQQLGTAVATQASESKVDAERLQRMVQQLGTAVATQASESKLEGQRLQRQVEQLGKAVGDRASEAESQGLQADMEGLKRKVEQLQREKAFLEAAVFLPPVQDGVLFTGARPLSLAVTPDARRVVWGNGDGSLHVHTLASRTSRAADVDIEGHSDLIRSVAVTPDGRYAVSASEDKHLRVWDLEARGCVATLRGHTDGVRTVAVTPDGRRAVSAGYDATVRVWDLQDYGCLATLRGHKGTIIRVACTPDSRHAISFGTDQTLRKWSLQEGSYKLEALAMQDGREGAPAVAVTPSGHAVVAWSNVAGLRVLDLSSLDCIATLGPGSEGPCKGRPWIKYIAVAATPDGGHALCNDGSRLTLWDLVSRTCVGDLVGHADDVMSVAVAPGGRWAVSSGADETVRIWDLQARLAQMTQTRAGACAEKPQA